MDLEWLTYKCWNCMEDIVQCTSGVRHLKFDCPVCGKGGYINHREDIDGEGKYRFITKEEN